MTIKHCACCSRPFEPCPHVPNQAFCRLRACQRARKRQWQRDKLKSDADYSVNQRAAQRAWTERNPDYWRNYRDISKSREQQNVGRRKSGNGNSPRDKQAKMDVCAFPAGLYQITWHPGRPLEGDRSRVVEITPVSSSIVYKMVLSREDLIDGSTNAS